MDNLPPEILLYIAESSDTPPELLKYRRISHRFKQVVDDKCKPHAFHLLRNRCIPAAADDALLAIRLKRIPRESCCHYDHTRGDYSFHPSRDFFQAIMDETEVPPGYPCIPAATWLEEVEAAMDLYLLVLAFMSTNYRSGINSQYVYPGGTELPNVDPADEWPKVQTNTYIRSFFRIFVFTTVYAPRVFVEPFAAVTAILGDNPRGETSHMHAVVMNLVMKELAKYSVMENSSTPLKDRSQHALFDGFFEWLYAQPEPRECIALPSSFQDPALGDPDHAKTAVFPGEERRQLALMQLLKVHKSRADRRWGYKPEHGYHVASRFNPIHPGLTESAIVYRQPLQVSIWSEPQTMIDGWADDKAFSVVLRHPEDRDDRHIPDGAIAIVDESEGYWSFDRICAGELKNRFGLRYVPQDIEFLAVDYGLLDPRPELEDWE